jgi:hypothetical protein
MQEELACRDERGDEEEVSELVAQCEEVEGAKHVELLLSILG